MERCKACGRKVMLTEVFLNENVCRRCCKAISYLDWKDRNFETLDELIDVKTAVIGYATQSNISVEFINNIRDYFEEYERDGFLATIDGRMGQTLKIMSEYCVITTDNENSRDRLMQEFYAFDHDYEELDVGNEFTHNLSAADKKQLTQGLLSGRIIQAGIGAAVAASINQQEKEAYNERVRKERHKLRERIVSVGERRIDLSKIAAVEVYSAKGIRLGYLKFIPKNIDRNALYDCEYFFFSNSLPFESKKIKNKVENAQSRISSNIQTIEQREKQAIEEMKRLEQASRIDVFEELRKYKQLFDEGIITENEFALKKKKLLDI